MVGCHERIIDAAAAAQLDAFVGAVFRIPLSGVAEVSEKFVVTPVASVFKVVGRRRRLLQEMR